MRTRAFTLTELLIALATMALLAAILMPVFRVARDSAKATTCISNFHQTALATQLYLVDYEDRLIPVNHRPGLSGNATNDRTWVQIVQPYLRSFAVFRCPSDYGRRPSSEGVFDADLVPGDSEARFYEASKRSNLGYNHLYLAPVVRTSGGPWTASPRTAGQAADPSRTLLFVDSVWEVNSRGKPSGGGRWVVTPPCRFETRGAGLADSFGAEGAVHVPEIGWQPQVKDYGGVWPWHNNRVNVVRLDSSAKSLSLNSLTAGCEALARWTGKITDNDSYMWDLR